MFPCRRTAFLDPLRWFVIQPQANREKILVAKTEDARKVVIDSLRNREEIQLQKQSELMRAVEIRKLIQQQARRRRHDVGRFRSFLRLDCIRLCVSMSMVVVVGFVCGARVCGFQEKRQQQRKTSATLGRDRAEVQ